MGLGVSSPYFEGRSFGGPLFRPGLHRRISALSCSRYVVACAYPSQAGDYQTVSASTRRILRLALSDSELTESNRHDDTDNWQPFA
jgi:hypothetical protein